jgi:hypothetical protein
MNNFKVGDLVSAYKKGYHEIVEIAPSGLIGYQIRFKEDGSPVKGKATSWCHPGYCKPMLDVVEYQIKKMEETIEKLKKLL